MAVPTWQAGTLYNPGDLVKPASSTAGGATPPGNQNFASGDTGWNKAYSGSGPLWDIAAIGGFDGATYAGRFGHTPGVSGNTEMLNDTQAPVTPGQKITAKMAAQVAGSHCGTAARLYWFDGSDLLINYVQGNIIGDTSGGWRISTVAAVAPAGAAYAAVGVSAERTNTTDQAYVSDFTWDYFDAGTPIDVIFQATQTNAGYSGTAEPAWPNTVGATVVDNQVTWTGVDTSRVTWTAHPILETGSSEPTWPTVIGAAVNDGTVQWIATSRAITDTNCPHSKIAAIAASHVFAGDIDIVRFCAVTNPLDWTTVDDAGFLPTGLQTYGANPNAVLNLYRGSLVAMNSAGFQMWQVDPDPQNMALLDGVPVGSTYQRAAVPVANDLLFLTQVGVRNMGIAGASNNLQAGMLGQPIDVLVRAAIKDGTYEPFAFYFPGLGQYMLVFGPQMFVLTLDDAKNRSWARYEFPEAITDATLDGDTLLFRTVSNYVWRFDEDTLVDDYHVVSSVPVFTLFTGLVRWNYLDFGSPGADKSLSGFDITADGTTSVQIGYNEKDVTQLTDAYAVDGDTVTGTMIPLPLTAPSFSFSIAFDGNQAWEWQAANLYYTPTAGK